MTRVNALDGDEPEALWYLAVAAAQKGKQGGGDPLPAAPPRPVT
jgi:cytochrome c-type biogenesis protein CcmH/NrfG